MRQAAQYLDKELFLEYWGSEVKKYSLDTPEARIRYWLTKADEYAQEWTPSEYLFLDLQ